MNEIEKLADEAEVENNLPLASILNCYLAFASIEMEHKLMIVVSDYTQEVMNIIQESEAEKN